MLFARVDVMALTGDQVFTLLEALATFWNTYFSLDKSALDNPGFSFQQQSPQAGLRYVDQSFGNLKLIFQFLEEIVDLKKENFLICFMLLRQLDLFINSVKLDAECLELARVVYLKVLTTQHDFQMHQLSAKLFLNFSHKIFLLDNNFQVFLQFCVQNFLFFDKFALRLLRQSLAVSAQEPSADSSFPWQLFKLVLKKKRSRLFSKLEPQILLLVQNSYNLGYLLSGLLKTLKALYRRERGHNFNRFRDFVADQSFFRNLMKAHTRGQASIHRVVKLILQISKLAGTHASLLLEPEMLNTLFLDKQRCLPLLPLLADYFRD